MIEKVLNKKSLLIVGILVLLILSGVGLLAYARLRKRDNLLYRKGMLYLRSGNPTAAVQNLRLALEKNPDLKQARIGIVRALSESRQFAEANDELNRAVEEGMSKSEAALLRAQLMTQRAIYRLRSAGDTITPEFCDQVLEEDLDPAIRLTEEHADRAEEPAQAYVSLGERYMQKSRIIGYKWNYYRRQAREQQTVGRAEEASELAQKARALQPELAQPQKKAMAAYRRALELDENLEEPRLAIAQHALSTYVPRSERARSVLQPLIERKPGHQRARLLLATAENMAGNYEAALEHVEAARAEAEEGAEGEKAEPEPVVLLTKAQILTEAKRWAEAEAPARAAFQEQANDPRAAYLLGRSLLEQYETGDELPDSVIEEAVTMLNRAVRARSSWPQARLSLARALMAAGNRQQARSELREAVNAANSTQHGNIRERRELADVRYKASMMLWREQSQDEGASVDTAADHAWTAFRTFPHRVEAYEAVTQARRAGVAMELGPGPTALLHASARLVRRDVDGALQVCREEAPEVERESARKLRLLSARILTRTGAYTQAVDVYQGLREDWEDPRPAYELAALHIQLGHLEDAEAVLRSLLEVSPGDRRAVLGLVGVLLRKGEGEEARSVLRNAEEQFGTTAMHALLIRLSLQSGQLEAAVNMARSITQAEPESAPARVLLAELLWRSADYEEAREAFDKAIELNPDYARAYNRGLLDLQRGREAEAVELFRKAAEGLPDQLTPRFYLGVALQRQGKPEQARKALQELLDDERTQGGAADLIAWSLAVLEAGQGNAERAVQLNEDVGRSEFGFREDRKALLQSLAAAERSGAQEAASAMNLLVAYNRSGHPEPMLEQIETVNQRLPEQALPRCLYANALDKQGRHEEAVQEYREVIEANPDFVFAQFSLARAHMGAGESTEAIHVLEDTLSRAEPQRAGQIHLLLGQLYQGENLLQQAERHYRAAIESPGNAAAAYNNLAYMLATQRGNAEAAVPLAEQAVKLGGGVPAFLDTLGWVYHLNGETDKAMRLLERAKARMPDEPSVRFHLGMVYLEAGRRADARAELREALSISDAFPEAEKAAEVLKSL